jgi:PKD repeat protein
MSTHSASTGSGVLQFGQTYYVRVMAWDSFGTPSAWSAGYSFTTPPGPYPRADFTFSPDRPFAGLPVQFTDTSTNSPAAWLWSFGDGYGDTVQNPAHAYLTEGTYQVMLQATNTAGSCSVTKTVDIDQPLPQYREVPAGGQPTPTPR